MRAGGSRKQRQLASAVVVGLVAVLSIFIVLSSLTTRTSPPAGNETLVMSLSPDSTQSHLLILVDNTGRLEAAVTQIEFDNSIVPTSMVMPSGGFNLLISGGFALYAGANGTLSVSSSDIGPLGPEETYTVTLWTAAGNNYSASITWP